MSLKNQGGIINIGTYNDNSREYNIDAHGRDLASVIRAIDAEDITPTEDLSSNSGSVSVSSFPFLTPKCIKEKRTEAVEAEIRAACKGTAEALWRTLWNNENLGYIEVEYKDATTIYRAIEKWYGKLPYKERNFRDARNKR